MPADFGERLAELRRERHLSQEELADRLGLSRQAISNWERAQSAPDTANLVALAGLYEVSLDELIEGATPVSTPTDVPRPTLPGKGETVLAAVASALLAAGYYAFAAQPLMSSTIDDLVEVFGLTVSPTLALLIFALEVVAVAVPLIALAIVLRVRRRRLPYIWLAPLAAFVVLAGTPSFTSILFGVPVREYTGIGGYVTQSLVLKADVLGLALGCTFVVFAQRLTQPAATQAAAYLSTATQGPPRSRP